MAREVDWAYAGAVSDTTAASKAMRIIAIGLGISSGLLLHGFPAREPANTLEIFYGLATSRQLFSEADGHGRTPHTTDGHSIKEDVAARAIRCWFHDVLKSVPSPLPPLRTQVLDRAVCDASNSGMWSTGSKAMKEE